MAEWINDHDPTDPFDEQLRSGLDRLRSVPEAASVGERLGRVVRLGRRRRQRRRLAGGAMVIVVAVLATVVSGLGRVDGASEHRIDLGDLPGVIGTRATPGTTTRIEVGDVSTTTTTVPAGTGDKSDTGDAADTSDTGGPPPVQPGSPGAATTRTTTPVTGDGPPASFPGLTTTSSTVPPILPVPPLPVADCETRGLTPAADGVLTFIDVPLVNDVPRPQCHVVRRGTNLVVRNPLPRPGRMFFMNHLVDLGGGGHPYLTVAEFAIDLGPVDTMLPAGEWRQAGTIVIERVPGSLTGSEPAPTLPVWIVAV